MHFGRAEAMHPPVSMARTLTRANTMRPPPLGEGRVVSGAGYQLQNLRPCFQ